MATPVPLSTEVFNRIMIDVAENFDKVIRQKLIATPSIYRDIQPKTVFPLGEGYVRKIHTFYPGRDDQAGLLKWEQETGYRAPGTNGESDPGFDPCEYKAYMLGYGFKTEQYSGWRTARRSPNYCINDFIYTWEFQQQLEMILDSFGDVGLQIWENFGHEMYMNFSRKFVCTDNLTPVEFTYLPFSSTEITIPANTVISTLTQRHLDALHQMLALQCKDGALAIDSDMPVFGLTVHPNDWDDILRRDSALREDFRFAEPGLLIDGVGKFKKWRGFAMTWDMTCARAKVIRKNANGTITLDRVVPYKEEAVTQGSRWEVDQDYLNAEYALINILIKGVYEKQIPPTAPGKVDGATFNTQPSNEGELYWRNIPDVVHNVLQEKGFFFSRFKAFAKPGVNSEYAVTLLVKRCPHTPQVLCEPCTAASGATAGAKTVTNVVAVDPSAAGTYYAVQVTLNTTTGLLCEATQAVTVTFKGGKTETALIADDSGAPTKYVITFASAAAWIAYDGGISTITCL